MLTIFQFNGSIVDIIIKKIGFRKGVKKGRFSFLLGFWSELCPVLQNEKSSRIQLGTGARDIWMCSCCSVSPRQVVGQHNPHLVDEPILLTHGVQFKSVEFGELI
jgi:hypothetical protein